MIDHGAMVGVDVGATFTDLFLLDAEAGAFPDCEGAIASRRRGARLLNGLKALSGVAAIRSIVHGTTVATNTLLERRGPNWFLGNCWQASGSDAPIPHTPHRCGDRRLLGELYETI
jgi:hypothetical protein